MLGIHEQYTTFVTYITVKRLPQLRQAGHTRSINAFVLFYFSLRICRLLICFNLIISDCRCATVVALIYIRTNTK